MTYFRMDEEDEFSSSGSVSMEDISIEEDHIPTDDDFKPEVRSKIFKKLELFYQSCPDHFFKSLSESQGKKSQEKFVDSGNNLYKHFLNIICPISFEVLLNRNEIDSKVSLVSSLV
jgi:hypothetical protein